MFHPTPKILIEDHWKLCANFISFHSNSSLKNWPELMKFAACEIFQDGRLIMFLQRTLAVIIWFMGTRSAQTCYFLTNRIFCSFQDFERMQPQACYNKSYILWVKRRRWRNIFWFANLERDAHACIHMPVVGFSISDTETLRSVTLLALYVYM